MDDLGANFFTLPLSEVERCKQIIFPDGFWVDENKKVYTPKISPLYRYRNTKKDAPKRLKSTMVVPTGVSLHQAPADIISQGAVIDNVILEEIDEELERWYFLLEDDYRAYCK